LHTGNVLQYFHDAVTRIEAQLPGLSAKGATLSRSTEQPTPPSLFFFRSFDDEAPKDAYECLIVHVIRIFGNDTLSFASCH
jgi:hypothetical protein